MTMVEIVEVNDAEEAAIVGCAIKMASALSARHTDEFAKPGNLVEVRFVTRHSLTPSSPASQDANDTSCRDVG